jgi:hypothetical protein
VLDIRRKLLKARDSYLDALWEASQAQSDLTAAVGGPTPLVDGPHTALELQPQAPQPATR